MVVSLFVRGGDITYPLACLQAAPGAVCCFTAGSATPFPFVRRTGHLRSLVRVQPSCAYSGEFCSFLVLFVLVLDSLLKVRILEAERGDLETQESGLQRSALFDPALDLINPAVA